MEKQKMVPLLFMLRLAMLGESWRCLMIQQSGYLMREDEA